MSNHCPEDISGLNFYLAIFPLFPVGGVDEHRLVGIFLQDLPEHLRDGLVGVLGIQQEGHDFHSSNKKPKHKKKLKTHLVRAIK